VAPQSRPADLAPAGETVLEVRGLSRPGHFEDISFDLRRGEILGLAGMLGAGRTELLRALFGADAYQRGEIRLGGRPLAPGGPRAARRRGLALLPEDRAHQALVLPLGVRANLCLAGAERVGWHGLTWRARELAVARRWIDQLKIKIAGPEQPVAGLSGGNQQKVVLGKWLTTEPSVLLLDEPTRGIDLQAKQQIFSLIWDLGRRGIASLLVSSELEELWQVCHRILILKHGRLAGEVRPEELSADELYVRVMEA